MLRMLMGRAVVRGAGCGVVWYGMHTGYHMVEWSVEGGNAD